MSLTKIGSGRGWVLGLAMSAALLGGQAHALAPEHEVTRLMLATEKAVGDERWGEAGEFLNRLQGLQVEKPAEYYYYRGRVMANAGHHNEARAALENYVSMAGSDSRFYRESLLLITEIEKSQRTQKTTTTAEKAPVAVIEPAGRGNTAQLRRRYGARTDTEALTSHLNNLLEAGAWRQDQRIVRMDVPADHSFKVTVQGNELRIRVAERDSQGRMVIATEGMPVFGVNPMVKWDCEEANNACWVYDPRDGSRLFRLSLDSARAREIAATLGELIRTMQAPR
ncbi:hypothetical protein [Pseudidiomarina gelatinasegens]|uniref:hypothetical protein n=1 Tax=Pseudidiomarina gelatinasegens TaxID=2487740 RepID=UPI003A9773C4